jgi:hypothetical protein
MRDYDRRKKAKDPSLKTKDDDLQPIYANSLEF